MQVCIPSGVQRWVQKWLLVRGFCSARNPKISVLFCLPATTKKGPGFFPGLLHLMSPIPIAAAPVAFVVISSVSLARVVWAQAKSRRWVVVSRTNGLCSQIAF